MDEIRITPIAGSITDNFEELSNALDNQLAVYKGLVFTEESKKEAKATVAELRKGQKALTDRLKEVKKEYMLPWEAFNAKGMALADKFNEPICFINGQIEEFEEKRINEKRERIKALYSEMIPEEELKKYMPLDRIYNRKWENSTTSEKAIKDEISERRLAVKGAIETIKGMESEAEEQALDMYKATYDMAGVLQFIQRYEKQKQEIIEREAERLRIENEERIRREERQRIEAEKKLAEAVEEAKQEAIEQFIPVASEDKTSRYTYVIDMTDSERYTLEMYMDSVGISYTIFDF